MPKVKKKKKTVKKAAKKKTAGKVKVSPAKAKKKTALKAKAAPAKTKKKTEKAKASAGSRIAPALAKSKRPPSPKTVKAPGESQKKVPAEKEAPTRKLAGAAGLEEKARKKQVEERSLVLKPLFSKDELSNIRARLVGMLSSHREEIVQGVSSASERDIAHIQDSSDIATDSAEGDLTFRLAESIGVEAGEIERAIEKIDEGSYGYCDVSNKPIPKARLEFLPWASRLVEYQERFELRRKRRESGELDDLDTGDDLEEDN